MCGAHLILLRKMESMLASASINLWVLHQPASWGPLTDHYQSLASSREAPHCSHLPVMSVAIQHLQIWSTESIFVKLINNSVRQGVSTWWPQSFLPGLKFWFVFVSASTYRFAELLWMFMCIYKSCQFDH